MVRQFRLLTDEEIEYIYEKDPKLQDRGYKADNRDQYVQYLASNLPTLYMDKEWDTYLYSTTAQEKAIKILREEWLVRLDKGLGVLLAGNSGSGKTLLACLLLKDTIFNKRTAFFSTYPELVNLFGDTWEDGIKKTFYTKNVVESDLLIIDDIGTERVNSLTEIYIDNLIRDRVQNCRTTILTSNLKGENLRTEYGPRLYSMLEESFEVLIFNGKDNRKGLMAKKLKAMRDEIKGNK
jgi:DNA replication protein DnaC